MSSEVKTDYSIPPEVHGVILSALRAWEKLEKKPIELRVVVNGFNTDLRISVPKRWRVTPLRPDQTARRVASRHRDQQLVQRAYDKHYDRENLIRQRFNVTRLFGEYDSLALLEDTAALLLKGALERHRCELDVSSSRIGVSDGGTVSVITRLANVEMIPD